MTTYSAGLAMRNRMYAARRSWVDLREAFRQGPAARAESVPEPPQSQGNASMRTNAALARRLANVEARLAPQTRIIVASDAGAADRIQATSAGGVLVVLTGVPR